VVQRFRPLGKNAKWPPAKLEPSSFWLGHFRGESERIADQVVLAVDRADDQMWLEIHCHGGREVVRWVLEILQSEGIAVIDWRELRKRTEKNVMQVEAEIALADALTARSATILLDQVNRAFERDVNKIDLAPGWDFGPDIIRVSAKTGEGLPDLCQAISRWLVPDPPPAGAGVPYTPDLAARLRAVDDLARAGRMDAAFLSLRVLA
jgi:tRNA U34 5-carboxymethylaminomethyl modifying GTPase MnmE/TrmE